MQGRSIREFASSASMSAGTLHNYLNDESLPTLDKLIALANTGNVSINWLATGRGPMHKSHFDAAVSGGAVPSAQTGNGGNLNPTLLVAVLECLDLTIDRLKIPMSAVKKAGVAVSIYDLYSELGEQAINKEKVVRLIEATIA